MFTGIIEEIGIVKDIKKTTDGMKLIIDGNQIISDVEVGQSISVSGVCTTVTSLKNKLFSVDIMNESLKRSNLKYLSLGDKVNLERALKITDRLDGHIVAGHVDGVGKIVRFQERGFSTEITIEVPSKLLKYVVEKGSVAVDGISLTVANVCESNFKIDLIPHSSENTTLLGKSQGDFVNIEVDILAKYMEKLLNYEEKHNEIDMNLLSRNGFC